MTALNDRLPQQFSDRVDQIRDKGRRRAQQLLEGRRRLRQASRKELRTTIKEARQQLSALGQAGHHLREEMEKALADRERLTGQVADLQQHVQRLQDGLRTVSDAKTLRGAVSAACRALGEDEPAQPAKPTSATPAAKSTAKAPGTRTAKPTAKKDTPRPTTKAAKTAAKPSTRSAATRSSGSKPTPRKSGTAATTRRSPRKPPA